MMISGFSELCLPLEKQDGRLWSPWLDEEKIRKTADKHCHLPHIPSLRIRHAKGGL